MKLFKLFILIPFLSMNVYAQVKTYTGDFFFPGFGYATNVTYTYKDNPEGGRIYTGKFDLKGTDVF